MRCIRLFKQSFLYYHICHFMIAIVAWYNSTGEIIYISEVYVIYSCAFSICRFGNHLCEAVFQRRYLGSKTVNIKITKNNDLVSL